MTLSNEHQDEEKGMGEVQTSVFGFIGRFAVVHTITYFVAGLIFSCLLGYEEIFASPVFSYMRPFDSPLVILVPLFQLIRGPILALAFLPFRKVIIGNKRGWIYLFGALWILTELGANTPSPSTIEGFIYANVPLESRFFGYPEHTLQTLAFSWLFCTWERRPERRLSIAFIAVLAIIAALLILGVLVS